MLLVWPFMLHSMLPALFKIVQYLPIVIFLLGDSRLPVGCCGVLPPGHRLMHPFHLANIGPHLYDG